MTWRVSAAIAAGAFALGVSVASAPAVLGHGPTNGDPRFRAMASHMAGMAEHMADGHMAEGDMGGMRSMMTMMSGATRCARPSMPMTDPEHRAHHSVSARPAASS